MSRRVSDWTRRLEPVLRQQEESVAFDIFSYADSLLSKVSETVALPETARTRRSVGSFGGRVTDIGADMDEESDTADQVVGIEEIAAGMDASEFSRMFLACLQLANSGNIDIIASEQMNSTTTTTTTTSSSSSSTPQVTRNNTFFPNLFGIQLLNANANFGLQMNLNVNVDDDVEVHKATGKSSSSSSTMRSKTAPVSTLSSKASHSNNVPNNE